MMPTKTTTKRRTTAKKTAGKKTSGKKTVRSPAYSTTQIADAKKLATAVWKAANEIDPYEVIYTADEYGMPMSQFQKITIAANTNAILEGHVKRVIEPVCFEEALDDSAA